MTRLIEDVERELIEAKAKLVLQAQVIERMQTHNSQMAANWTKLVHRAEEAEDQVERLTNLLTETHDVY